jgi:hypothetical protein
MEQTHMPYDLDTRPERPRMGLRAAVIELMSRNAGADKLDERELRAALRALVVATRDRAGALRDAYGARRDDPSGRIFATYAD